MDLKIDPETMRQLVQAAVIDKLSPEEKTSILSKAVASLFVPTNAYGSKTSPLEDLFAREAVTVARMQVQAELEKPENVQVIRGMVVAAFEIMLSDAGRREKAIDRMADALTTALCEKEYR
jgi:streptomycin 6-kinase